MIPSACFLRSASFQMFLEGTSGHTRASSHPPPPILLVPPRRAPVEAVGVRRLAPSLGFRCQPEPWFPAVGGEPGVRWGRAPQRSLGEALPLAACGDMGRGVSRLLGPVTIDRASGAPAALMVAGGAELRRTAAGAGPRPPQPAVAHLPDSRRRQPGRVRAVGIFRSCGGRRV